MSGPISPPLTVTTVSGSPSGRPITTIKVSNGDLTISGSTATIDTSGGGGGGTGTVTSIATTAPITGGTITTTGTIGISQADGSTDGFLSSTDWNTFDAKQDTISLTTTGTSGVATLVGATLNIPNYTVTVPTGADPTATVGPSATNGSATTFMRSDAAPALADTLVSPGSYTLSSITVDQQGRITAASSGTDTNTTYDLKAATSGSDAEIQLDASTGTDTAVKIAAGSGISVAQSGGDTITITNTSSAPSGANPSATISGSAVDGSATTFMRSDAAPALADTGVTANSYTYTSLTVDAQGRITAASSGTAPSDTTYDLKASQSGDNAEIQLDGSAGSDTKVTLAAGSNITLTESSGDTITIAASGGGSGVGGSGTIGTIPVFVTDTTTIGDSRLTQPNSYETLLSGTSGVTLVIKATDGNEPNLKFLNSSSQGTFFQQAADGGSLYLKQSGGSTKLWNVTTGGAVTINEAYTLPTVVTGANDYVLTAQTDGTTAWAAAGGGGATSLGGLSDATTPATNNLGLGSDAVGVISTGDSNVGVGIGSLKAITTSSNNTAMGTETLYSLVGTSGNNTVMGYRAGYFSTNDENNVLIGKQAGFSINGGDDNIIIGTDAGDGITTGNGNLVLGRIDPASATADEQLIISSPKSGTSLTWLKGDSTGALTINGAYTLPTVVTGANNYVLTAQTDGSTAWAAAGGGSSGVSNVTGLNETITFGGTYKMYDITRQSVWSTGSNGTATFGALFSDFTVAWPFTSPKSGTPSALSIYFGSGTGGGASVAIYSSETDGSPDTLMVTGNMDYSASAVVTDSSLSGTGSLVAGDMYWCAVKRKDSASDTSFTVSPSGSRGKIAPSNTLNTSGNCISTTSITASDSFPSTFTAASTIQPQNTLLPIVGVEF